MLFQETDARVYSDILFYEMLQNESETGFVISQTKEPMLQISWVRVQATVSSRNSAHLATSSCGLLLTRRKEQDTLFYT